MLTAIDSNGVSHEAWATDKTSGPFFCKCCDSEVFLHKGLILAHHFAHKKGSSCPYEQGETDQHRDTKINIYNGLKNHPSVARCELEHRVGNVIPDIYCELKDGTRIAIEIQRSEQDIETIKERTLQRSAQGLYTVWIVLSDTAFKACRNGAANIPPWVRYLHCMYFGRFYLYSGHGAYVYLVHTENPQSSHGKGFVYRQNLVYYNSCGRDAHYWAPPAQFRTCGFPASGSSAQCSPSASRFGEVVGLKSVEPCSTSGF